MDKEVKIVLGSLFGDEGKGVTVQYLCKKAIDEGKKPLVIRYSGGPQAAHTIQNGDITHICSTFGSGVLLGVPTLIVGTAYFDPICAQNEWAELVNKMGNINNVPPLLVLGNTPVITPYDVFSGRKNEKIKKDGTCGKGIYPTFRRSRIDHKCTTILMSKDFQNPMEPYRTLRTARNYYGAERDESMENMFCNAVNNTFYSIVGSDVISFYDVLIFEGSQGLLLDMERGFYPNVTPSRVGLNGIPEEFFENAEVYLVARTYLTRHGNGYEPNSRFFPFDISNKFETNVLNEYQGEFKVGLFDFDLLNRAFDRHCLDVYQNMYGIKYNLVLTHFDLITSNDGNQNPYYYIKDRKIGEYFYDKNSVNGICSLFERSINLPIEKVYVNDSPKSNLRTIGEFNW